ncbi:MAG TPA: hypothetical protein VG078_03675 [Acidimicrobiales bacterium]|nr:hypothetical protein [Acidimicrobiales bacterium]
MTRPVALPIERLSAELRSLRLRLIRYEQRARDAWSADLEAYDRRLLDAAAMLDVAAPPPETPLPLTATDRASLEEDLAAAGLEVRTDPM